MTNITCRATPKATICGENPLENVELAGYESFTVCLPFGGTLTYDGRGLTYTEPVKLTGVGLIHVIDGCITDLSAEEVPSYTPPPCTPAVSPCDGSGGTTLALSTDSRNLLTWDASGRLLGKVDIRAGDGIKITGSASATDPMIISSAVEANDTYILSTTPDLISISGTGSAADKYQVSHTRQASKPAASTGLTVDEGGHVVSYTPAELTAIVTAVVGVPTVVDVTTENSIVSVTLPVQNGLKPIPPQIITPTRVFNVDVYGRIVSSEEAPATETQGGIFSTTFEGLRSQMNFQFVTTGSSKFRIRYRGFLGNVSGLSDGLVTPPSNWSMQIDLQSVQFYIDVLDNKALGIELLTTMVYAAGTHVINITPAINATAFGVLDVIPCL